MYIILPGRPVSKVEIKLKIEKKSILDTSQTVKMGILDVKW